MSATTLIADGVQPVGVQVRKLGGRHYFISCERTNAKPENDHSSIAASLNLGPHGASIGCGTGLFLLVSTVFRMLVLFIFQIVSSHSK